MKDCEGDINQKGHIVHSVLSARLMEGDCILLIFLLNSAIPEAEYLENYMLRSEDYKGQETVENEKCSEPKQGQTLRPPFPSTTII